MDYTLPDLNWWNHSDEVMYSAKATGLAQPSNQVEVPRGQGYCRVEPIDLTDATVLMMVVFVMEE